MKSIVSKIFLSLYFCFQCLATLFNILFYNIGLFFIVCIGFNHATYQMTNENFLVTCLFCLTLILIFLFYIFYSVVIIVSAISTIKIIKNKPLTKFQKFAMVTFPIVTISFIIGEIINENTVLDVIFLPLRILFPNFYENKFSL